MKTNGDKTKREIFVIPRFTNSTVILLYSKSCVMQRGVVLHCGVRVVNSLKLLQSQYDI